VSRNSAEPCSQSTLASAVLYTFLAAGGRSAQGALPGEWQLQRGAQRWAAVMHFMCTLLHHPPPPLTVDAGRDGGEHKGQQEVPAKQGQRRRLLAACQVVEEAEVCGEANKQGEGGQ